MFFMIGIGLGLVLLVLAFIAFVFRNIWAIAAIAVVAFIGWKLYGYIHFSTGDPKQVELRNFSSDRIHPQDVQAPTWRINSIVQNNQSKTISAVTLRIRLRLCEKDVFSTSITGDDKGCENIGNELIQIPVTVPPSEIREITGKVSFSNVPSNRTGTAQLIPQVDSVVVQR